MLLASSLGGATGAKEGCPRPSANQWSQTSQLTGTLQSSLECERSIAVCVHLCLSHGTNMYVHVYAEATGEP